MIQNWLSEDTLNSTIPLIDVRLADVFNFADEVKPFFEYIANANASNSLDFDNAVMTAIGQIGLNHQSDEYSVSLTPSTDPAYHDPANDKWEMMKRDIVSIY